MKENKTGNSLKSCTILLKCLLFWFCYLLATPVIIQLNYSSELTVDSPTYYRDCKIPKCYYETLEINVNRTASYVLWSESDFDTYGYIYKNDFDSLKPSENLLVKHNGYCNGGQFKLFINLEIDTRYVLVVTTHRPKTIGNFSITISGPENITVNHISKYWHWFSNLKSHRWVI